MTQPKQDQTDTQIVELNNSDSFPVLCGQGCNCGKETKTNKLKIAIMLVLMVAVVIAFIYKMI